MNADLLHKIAQPNAGPGGLWQQAGNLLPHVIKFMHHITATHFPYGLSASAETGCGISTILLSNLSRRHLSFTLGGGIDNSLEQVRSSPFFKPEVVEFTEGPSQLTLPAHKWDTKLDLALIDGAHAYPFPELDYFYIYPQLNTWAFLVIDDIHIPTIRRMYEFIREDAMFHEYAVVGTTAFMLRTDAPTFNPLGDSWNEQKYNLSRFAK